MKKFAICVAVLTFAIGTSPLAAQPAPPPEEEGHPPPPKPFPKTEWKPGWHMISYYLETVDVGPFKTFQACQVQLKKDSKAHPDYNYACVLETEPRGQISPLARH